MNQARRWRRWMRISLVAAGVIGITFGVSWIWPWAFGVSQMGGGATRGYLFVGWSDAPVRVGIDPPRTGPQRRPIWELDLPGGPLMALGPEAAWRPSITRGRVIVSVGSLPLISTYTLQVSFIPLWWPGVFFVLLVLACWWRLSRLARPGYCPSCRYDMRGLVKPVCPECGSPVDTGRVAPHDAPAHDQH